MKQYIKVYKALIKLNLANLVAFRANFINGLVTSICYGGLSFLLLILLTSQTPVVFGWKREEMIFLMGVYNIAIGGFFHGIFSRNFDEFADIIDLGKLDGVLLKPIDPQFLMTCTIVGLIQIVRIVMGLAVCIYIAITYHMVITMSSVITAVVLSIFGIGILYSLWFSVMTLTVWNPRLSNLVELMYHMNDLTRFPPQMFQPVENYLFFIIPYTFIIVTPTKALLRQPLSPDIFLLLGFAFLFVFLSRRFWQFALKSYTSASS